jgi:hypothetical protein
MKKYARLANDEVITRVDRRNESKRTNESSSSVAIHSLDYYFYQKKSHVRYNVTIEVRGNHHIVNAA